MLPDAPAGRHCAARHRGSSGFERVRDRVCDTLLDLPRPRAVGGRALAATAVGGVLVVAAVAGTQAAVTGPTPTETAAAEVAADALVADRDATAGDRGAQRASRDAARPTLDDAKRAATTAGSAAGERAGVVTETSKVDTSDPKALARAMLAEFEWGEDQFGCLDDLWVSESNWRVDADNPTSSAYGIPQALPGSKMASEGDDWATNPVTQISWGLKYIEARYGTPCAADGFKRGNGWY